MGRISTMNETQVKALIATLQNQRNNALDAVAQSESTVAVLRSRIEELERQLASTTHANGEPA